MTDRGEPSMPASLGAPPDAPGAAAESPVPNPFAYWLSPDRRNLARLFPEADPVALQAAWVEVQAASDVRGGEPRPHRANRWPLIGPRDARATCLAGRARRCAPDHRPPGRPPAIRLPAGGRLGRAPESTPARTRSTEIPIPSDDVPEGEAGPTDPARVAAAVLGPAGRLISESKSGYRRHPRHVVAFNAGICLEEGVEIWWGDLDPTLDEARIADLARRSRPPPAPASSD